MAVKDCEKESLASEMMEIAKEKRKQRSGEALGIRWCLSFKAKVNVLVKMKNKYVHLSSQWQKMSCFLQFIDL